MREEEFASAGEFHATRRAFEQDSAKLVFEMSNLAADGGLRNTKAASRTSHVALLCDRDEVLNLREAHGPESTPTRASSARLGDAKRVLDARRPHPQGSRLMSVEILGPREVDLLRRAGQAAAATLAFVGQRLRAGVATADIDTWVREHTKSRGGTPSQLGYHGFPAAVCTSRNHVVCHGIPGRDDVLAEGDIINVDVTTNLGGYHGDTSGTFMIGEVSSAARHVVDVALRCRDAGIAVVREGARLGDIGATIAELAEREGCSVVREFGGHGIGRRMHMAPHVSHFGERGEGLRLRAGMVLTSEPMVNLGGPDVRVLADEWTVVTADGSLSAQFEHTVLVTSGGCEVLTAEPLPHFPARFSDQLPKR